MEKTKRKTVKAYYLKYWYLILAAFVLLVTEALCDLQLPDYMKNIVNTLTDLNSLIGYISAGVILILLGVAVFLISNTITVGISVRKEEIAIMKLIGATDYFVRAPFVVEGIVIGLIGAAIPLGILYALYGKIVMYISDKFSFISNMMKFLSVNEIFHNLIPVALILGVGIGFIGSRITIRKHLRV